MSEVRNKTKEAEALVSEKKSTSTKEHGEFNPPDGGWGWVVCFASFWCNGTIFGVLNTFGVIYPAILETYADKDDKDIAFKASWVGSLSTGMTFFMSPIASILVDRFGVRPVCFVGGILATTGLVASSFVNQLGHLYLCYGILLGIGSSLAYTPSLVILGHYFKKRIGLVNGIVTTGSAVFTIVMPFGLKHLLSLIGLQHTIQVLAGLYSTLILCALTFKPLNIRQSHTRSDGAPSFFSTESIVAEYHACMRIIRKFLNVRIWRNKNYVIWIVGMAVALFGYFIPFVHLVQFVKETMPGKDGEILVMCIGATSGAGRLIIGKLSDFKSINRIRLHQACIALLGIFTIIIPFATYFEVLIFLTLLMGFCDGCMVCLLGPIAFDLVGHKGASQAVGFLLGLISIPLMVGPPIAGFMHDAIGNYDAAFWYAGGPPLLGATIMFLISQQKQHYPAKKEVEEFAIAVDDLEDSDNELPLSGGVWQETTNGKNEQINYSSTTKDPILVVDSRSYSSTAEDSEEIEAKISTV